jgi:hypothetical protein
MMKTGGQGRVLTRRIPPSRGKRSLLHPRNDVDILGRSDMMWKKLFAEAGLELVKEQLQYGLPEFLYDVKMHVRSHCFTGYISLCYE